MCECGDFFEDLGDEAQDHVLELHLDLVETFFEDMIEEADFNITEADADALYEDAIADAVDELMDEIIEWTDEIVEE